MEVIVTDPKRGNRPDSSFPYLDEVGTNFFPRLLSPVGSDLTISGFNPILYHSITKTQVVFLRIFKLTLQ